MSAQGSAERATGVAEPTFAGALRQIAARAAELDANPRFPRESFESLKGLGIPQLAGDREACGLGREIALIRALAGVDGSTARILDGHFNGGERIAMGLEGELRERELQGIAKGRLLLGVWGADPSPGDGPPARLDQPAGGTPVLRGVKVFCSGAGGVQRALVVARDERGARRLVYVDLNSRVWVDRNWYRASGLRASESHRVEFRETPVLAILGGDDEIMREPWFSRDAVRTAATWAGLADCIWQATIDALNDTRLDDVRLHTIGRMRVARSSIDRWLDHSVCSLEHAPERWEGDRNADDPVASMRVQALSGECRIALADATRLIAAEAARVCGSRALAGGGVLERARRDLDLFLLQHRLDPKLVELGARSLQEPPQRSLDEPSQ